MFGALARAPTRRQRIVVVLVGLYSVPCFHIAHITVASLRASATIAMRLLRFSAIERAHTTIGSSGRVRHSDYAAWTSNAFR